MAEKIPATVVTGFLGAGKTTLIRHLLANAGGKRIALIINEFGDLGVDGGILKGCGSENCSDDDVVELSNGCICCTVAEDFVPTLKMLIEKDQAPDHIVIETSGLALPQPLVRAFNWPEIRNRVTVDGVVAVVDGPAVAAGQFAGNVAAVDAQRQAMDGVEHDTPLSELFEDQMACADMVIVNKSDLLNGEAESLTSSLRNKARTGVQVLQASHGAIDPRVLLGMGVGAEADMSVRHEIHHHHHDDDDDHDHHHEHSHDEFDSFVVDLAEIETPNDFLKRIESVIRSHDILRLKGFVAVAGKPMRMVVQAVGPRIDTHFDRPFASDEPRQTRLVVIGQHGLDQATITKELGA